MSFPSPSRQPHHSLTSAPPVPTLHPSSRGCRSSPAEIS
jgi:hypothetical protein